MKTSNSLPSELQQIENQFAALVPECEKERDLEVLRFVIATQTQQLNEIQKQAAYTEKAKLRTFFLGGTLGACLGAVLMFFIISACFPPVVAPAPPLPIVESPMLDDTILTPRSLTPHTSELIREFVPPPSAFIVPFLCAALMLAATTLVVRHVRLRVVI